MPGTSLDTYENLKRAFKTLFRRKKPVAVVKATQAAAPPPVRSLSLSATVAPEAVVITHPSWPLLNQSPTTGHFHATAIELPGSLAVNPVFAAWQNRSKSDAGPLRDNSDLFSELDANSVRESNSEAGTPDDQVQELDSPSVDRHFMPRFEFKDNAQLGEALETTLAAEVVPEEEEAEIEQEDQDQPETQLKDEAKDAPLPGPAVEQPEAADESVAAPEREQETKEDAPQSEPTQADVAEPEEPEHTRPAAISAEDLERNDSANGTVVKDDVSSTYSTIDSVEDDSASEDEGTPSTPRTASVAHADSIEYFDEKIPVLSEPPPVLQLTPAPGMAATSGPLEEFRF